MLRALSHLGFPFMAARLLNVAFAVAGIAVIWFKAPFRNWEKWLIIFGYFTAYEYNAIARSYALLALLLYCVAASDRQRHAHPVRYGLLLALLANVTLHGLMIAGLFALWHASEVLRRRTWTRAVTVGATVAGLGFAFAVWSMRQPPDLAPVLARWHLNFWSMESVLEAFLPLPLGLHPFWNSNFLNVLSWTGKMAVVVVLIAGACYTLRNDRRMLALFAAVTGAFEVLFALRYYGGAHHAGLIFLVFLACVWVARARQQDRVSAPAIYMACRGGAWKGMHRALSAFLPVVLIVQVTAAGIAVGADGRGSFSGSGTTAKYLETSGILDNGTFLVFYPSFSAMGVLGQMKETHREVFSLEYGKFLTYTPWARPFEDGLHLTLDQVLTKVDAAGGEAPRTVLVLHDEIFAHEIPLNGRLHRLATFGADSIGCDERFDVYEVMLEPS